MWIINIIKNIFYTAYCTGDKTFIDKLYCVRKRLKIKPYSANYQTLIITTLEQNIIVYNNILRVLVLTDKQQLLKPYVKSITNSSFVSKPYSNWFSNERNEFITNVDEVWNEFIELSIKLVLYYDINSTKVTDGIAYANSKLIKPYIINIEQILDNVIVCQTWSKE